MRTEIKTVPSIWYISNVQGCTRTDWLAKMAQLWFNLSSVWSRQILICKTQCVTKFHKSANDRERWSRKAIAWHLVSCQITCYHLQLKFSVCILYSICSPHFVPRLHFVLGSQSLICSLRFVLSDLIFPPFTDPSDEKMTKNLYKTCRKLHPLVLMSLTFVRLILFDQLFVCSLIYKRKQGINKNGSQYSE